MTITIHKNRGGTWVDRDGVVDDLTNKQGFHVSIDGAVIHFENEDDALEMSRLIVERLGYRLFPIGAKK